MDKFEFDIRRYSGDTTHLCVSEHGAYLLLLLHYMATELPLLDDDDALANIARVTKEQWATMSAKIRKFFKAKDGRLYQKHCERVLGARGTQRSLLPKEGNDAPRKRQYGRPAAPARPIAPDWTPSDADRDFAVVECGLDPAKVVPEFVDFWRGCGAAKADWGATFRNRCRQIVANGGGGSRATAGASGTGGHRGFTSALVRAAGPGANGVDRR